jgi:hypothetical protein
MSGANKQPTTPGGSITAGGVITTNTDMEEEEEKSLPDFDEKSSVGEDVENTKMEEEEEEEDKEDKSPPETPSTSITKELSDETFGHPLGNLEEADEKRMTNARSQSVNVQKGTTRND